jgi:tetratricopeptide (TPR) repeat protein
LRGNISLATAPVRADENDREASLVSGRRGKFHAIQQTYQTSRRKTGPCARRLLLLAVLVTAALGALPMAWGAPKLSPAAKIAVEAAKALKVGDFSQAIALYSEAYRSDQRPEYLWFLARAEHQSGQSDQALDHYRAYLASPGTVTEYVPQARVFAEEIEKRRLEARVQQVYVDAFARGKIQEAQLKAVERTRELARVQEAEAAAGAGDDKQAAKLYLAAYQAARDRDDGMLYKAAVAEQQAQNWQAAAAHFDEYVKRASPTSGNYSEAVTRLETLRRRLSNGITPEAPKPPPKPPAVSEPPADADPVQIGWSLVRIGGAVALVGAGSYVWTRSQQSDLDALLRPGDTGKIHDISREEAAARVKTINTHVVLSIALGGVGLAAAGVGTYLILRSPSKVAVLPGPVPAGFALAWRF